MLLKKFRLECFTWESNGVKFSRSLDMVAIMGEPVEDRVARLESDVAHVRSDIGEIKLDIRELRTAIAALRADVNKGDGSLREEMHKGDDSLREAIAALRQETCDGTAKLSEEIVRSSRGDRTRMYVLSGVMLSVLAHALKWI